MPRLEPRQLVARQFGSLRVFNYRVYFFGQLTSLVGTWMQTTGQAWLVLQLTDSPLALGTVTTLQFLPITLLTLFGGVFADRLAKRRLLIATQTASMVQALILGILVVTGWVELWHVYVLAFGLGIVNALDGPVRQAFVVELVGREQLVNAVALNSSIFNMARVLGPGFGGLMIALVGLSATFFINSASFIAVIGSYLIMKPALFHAVPKHPSTGNVLHQVAEGIRYSWKTPSILFIFIILAFVGTFGYNFTVVIPLVAEFILKVGPGKFGLLTSAMGIGSLLAALFLAATGKASTRILLISVSAFVVFFALIAGSRNYALTCVLFAVMGGAGVMFSTTVNTTLQITVPDELRGRVMSIFFLLFAGSTPIGGYLTGIFGEYIGVSQTLLIEAGICTLGVGLAVFYRTTHPAAFRPSPPPVQTASSPAGGH